MAKAYRMTPARRAALKRAQQVSARKRRRAGIKRGVKGVARVAGTVAAGVAVYHLERALRDPRGFARDVNDLKQFTKKKFGKGPKVDPNAPGKTLSRKPIRYYGRGRPSHIRTRAAGTRIRSRV